MLTNANKWYLIVKFYCTLSFKYISVSVLHRVNQIFNPAALLKTNHALTFKPVKTPANM